MSNFTLYTKWVVAQVICALIFSQNLAAQNSILYGMTQNGGADSVGAIIAYNINTGTENVVYSFKSDSDGQNPTGNLVYCPLNGLLYAFTTAGGKYLEGTIISFNPATNTEAVAWNLGHSNNGPMVPYADLVWDPAKQLFYGMTFGGGNNGVGTVISFNPAIDSIKTLWSFNYGSGASLPYSNFVIDPNNGLLYGMASQGGNNNDGAIIIFNTQTDTVHRVYNFNDGQSGETPNGSLVWSASAGLFYGLTSAGGTDSMGTIFSFNPVDSVETTLYNFGAGNDVQQPNGNLIYDQGTGLLFGTGYMGGANSEGGIFSFNPANNTEAVVYNFGSVSNDGSSPNGSLVYNAGNGLYYGLAQGGGANQGGTIFSFNPANNALVTLWSLGSGFDGSQPWNSFLLLNDNHPASISTVNSVGNISLYPNPTNGNFVLQTQNATGNPYTIYNTNGAEISTGTIHADIENISLGNATTGMYVLMIHTQQGPVPVRFAVVK